MQDALASAMRLLLRREHATRELEKKLTQKGYSDVDIAKAIAEVTNLGYLSDTRFAEHYVRHRASAGFGPLRISEEMRERGVSEQDIEAGLSLYEGDWGENARHVRDKKFGTVEPSDFKEKAKQMQFLQYRGFAHGEIRKVVEDEEC